MPQAALEAGKTIFSVLGSALFWAWAFAWSLNSAVFPPYATGMELAYTSSMATSVISALVIFFVFARNARLATRTHVTVFGGLATVATLVQVACAYADLSPALRSVLMVASGFASGVALVFLTIVWGARYTVNGRRADIAMVVSFLLSFFLNTLMGLLPYQVGSAILVLLIPASTVVWHIDVAQRQGATSDAESDLPVELVAGDVSLHVLPWRTMGIFSLVAFVAVFFQAFSPTDLLDGAVGGGVAGGGAAGSTAGDAVGGGVVGGGVVGGGVAGGVSGSPIATYLVAALLCFVYVFVIKGERREAHLQGACVMLFPLTAFALMLVVYQGGSIGALPTNILMGCTFFLHVVIWVQLIKATIRAGLAPFVAFGIGNIFVTCIQIAGTVVGRTAVLCGANTPQWVSAYAMAAVVLLMLGAILLFGRQNPTGADARAAHKSPYVEGTCANAVGKPGEYAAIQEIAQGPVGGLGQGLGQGPSEGLDRDSDRDPEDLDLAVASFAHRYGLSDREREVLALFVRGRNIPYVAEALVVTPGTVKSHSNHIFQKAHVASRQQLLDLFESESR